MSLVTRARAEYAANGRTLYFRSLCLVVGITPEPGTLRRIWERAGDECDPPANAQAMRPHIFGESHDAPANGR